MVRVTLEDGSTFHEPPYTLDEQLDIARRTNGGVVAFFTSRRLAAHQLPQEQPPQGEQPYLREEQP